jgi:hypothetical protein
MVGFKRSPPALSANFGFRLTKKRYPRMLLITEEKEEGIPDARRLPYVLHFTRTGLFDLV